MGDWIKIELNQRPEDFQWYWMCGIRDGKEIVGPVVAYYDCHCAMYYDVDGFGHVWMTHFKEIDVPELPKKELMEHKLEG